MVGTVDESVKVDKQGRLVVPSHLRENLGIKEGGRLMIYQDGRKLVLEPINEQVEKEVENWARATKETSIPMNREDSQASGKWISEEYARKKLGLL